MAYNSAVFNPGIPFILLPPPPDIFYFKLSHYEHFHIKYLQNAKLFRKNAQKELYYFP